MARNKENSENFLFMVVLLKNYTKKKFEESFHQHSTPNFLLKLLFKKKNKNFPDYFHCFPLKKSKIWIGFSVEFKIHILISYNI